MNPVTLTLSAAFMSQHNHWTAHTQRTACQLSDKSPRLQIAQSPALAAVEKDAINYRLLLKLASTYPDGFSPFLQAAFLQCGTLVLHSCCVDMHILLNLVSAAIHHSE